MTPGHYVLSQDVTNTRPDRRQRYDWRVQEVWHRGMEFTIKPTKYVGANDEIHETLVLLPTWAKWTHQTLPLTDDRAAKLILPALRPAPATPESTVHDLIAQSSLVDHGWAFEILAKLVENGHVTPALLAGAITAVERDQEDK